MGSRKHRYFSFKVRTKILGVLGLMSILFLCGYLMYLNLARRQSSLNKLIQEKELYTSVNALLQTRGEFLEKINFDYACFDWMVNFIHHPDTTEAELNISPPEMLGIDLMLVYNLDRQLVYSVLSPKNKTFTIEFPKAMFDLVYRKRLESFYFNTKYGLFKFVVSTVHPSTDIAKKTSPSGYLVVGKLFDQEYVKQIESTINCDLTFQTLKPDEKYGKSDSTEVVLESYNKVPVVKITISKNDNYLLTVKSLTRFINWFLGAFFIILFLVSLLTYNTLILKPLKVIQYSLDNQSEKGVRKLIYDRDEFGKISRLIIRFFRQQKTLTEKINKLNLSQKELKELNDQLNIQKEELETTATSLLTANESIQYQQKILTDNIYYASLVQKAALVPAYEISKVFSDYFSIFKPRDIVSGDFYWLKQHNGKYLVAVADCTGHGLSGSLMSMLGISFLNNIVSQLGENNYTAADILKNLRSSVVDLLHQQGSDNEIYDGMDIILCIFDFEEMELEFAAAYTPLYHLRKEKDEQHSLKVYKGDPMPVGIHEKKDGFTNHIIQLHCGDLIYLFTDGLIDQFGGPLNKKLLAKNLQQIILSVADKPLVEQKNLIFNAVEKWRGNNDQVDDITMLAFKI